MFPLFPTTSCIRTCQQEAENQKRSQEKISGEDYGFGDLRLI